MAPAPAVTTSSAQGGTYEACRGSTSNENDTSSLRADSSQHPHPYTEYTQTYTSHTPVITGSQVNPDRGPLFTYGDTMKHIESDVFRFNARSHCSC